MIHWTKMSRGAVPSASPVRGQGGITYGRCRAPRRNFICSGAGRTPGERRRPAREFSVSRQIIVGDVALLRAGGLSIAATPRGYMLPEERSGLIRTLACRHRADQMEDELNAIVDQGCTVIDVIVEHPIYGQLTGPLQLSSRYDVAQFVDRCRQSDALPLSNLTEGIHLHTISCPSEATFQRVRAALEQLGVLLEA